MPNYTKTFDQLIGSWGFTRLDTTKRHSLFAREPIETDRARSEAIIREHRDARGPKMPHFHFDYIDHPAIEAYAYYHEPQHCGFIAMFAGTVFLIHDIFYRLLSHPDVLATVGDSSVESLRHPFCAEGLQDDYKVLCGGRRPRSVRLENVAPRDAERKRYAEELARHALEFLVLHELSHITHGHHQYIYSPRASAAAGRVPFMMEMASGSSLSKSECLTRQAIETAADAYASVTTFLRHLQKPTEADRIARARLERGTELVVPDELLMFDWVFAMYVMFWLFGQNTDLSEIETVTHPPPRQRATMALTHVHALLRKKSPTGALSQFDRACPKALAAAADAIIDISGGKLATTFQAHLDAVKSGIFRKRTSTINARYRKIHNDVFKYSHAPA